MILVLLVHGWWMTQMTPLGINVPPIVTTVDRWVRQWIELAYVLAVLVLVHFVGALRHHFLKRNKCSSAWSEIARFTRAS
jgi:cytochrome b561